MLETLIIQKKSYLKFLFDNSIMIRKKLKNKLFFYFLKLNLEKILNNNQFY